LVFFASLADSCERELVSNIKRGLGAPSPYKEITFWFVEKLVFPNLVFFASLATLREKKASFS